MCVCVYECISRRECEDPGHNAMKFWEVILMYVSECLRQLARVGGYGVVRKRKSRHTFGLGGLNDSRCSSSSSSST